MNRLHTLLSVFTIVMFLTTLVFVFILKGGGQDEYREEYMPIIGFMLASAAVPLLAVGLPFVIDKSIYLVLVVLGAFIAYAIVTGVQFDFQKIATVYADRLSFVLYVICMGYTAVTMALYFVITHGVNREYKLENPTMNQLNANC